MKAELDNCTTCRYFKNEALTDRKYANKCEGVKEHFCLKHAFGEKSLKGIWPLGIGFKAVNIKK